jgi:hypothetical protein
MHGSSYSLAVVCVLLAAAIGLGLSRASTTVMPDLQSQILPQKRMVLIAAIAAILFGGSIVATGWTPPLPTISQQPVVLLPQP